MHTNGKLKVLVFDDEPQIIKSLRIALQSEGYDVLQAITGKDGLEQIVLQNPDLVVLDLGLPVDGVCGIR
jgi:two-component system KDP operon response regulator KdpE